MASTESDALTVSEPGASYRVVRAAKDWHCGGDRYAPYCSRMIRKGQQYVRAVMFKDHDVYAYVDRDTHKPLTRPMVTPLCFECASQYYLTNLLVIKASNRLTPPKHGQVAD